MRSRVEAGCRTSVAAAAAWLATSLALAAGPWTAHAARGDAKRAAPVEVTQEAGGFTITQDVRVSGAVRGDYESAIELLRRQQYAQGIALLEKVTANAPTVIAPHVDLGIAYGRSGELDKAQASLVRALELDPGHPVAYNELGRVQRRQGRFAEARASYERALQAYPGFHFAHRNLAILCDLYLQDFACALQHYEAYRQAVPDDQEAVKWIADVQNRTGR